MGMEFYYDLLSQPCRAVYLFFKTAGIEFEPIVVSLMKREHYQPEFTKKNPFHKIPIIDDDGFCIGESVAIMRYAAGKSDVAEHWYPRKDLRKQALVDEFLHWQHLCIRRPAVDLFLTLFRSKVEFPNFPKQPLDEKKRDKAKEDIERAVKHIDEYFLKDKPFVGGEEISVADIMGVCELTHLEGVNMDNLYKSNPKVDDWIKRVADKLQPHFGEANKNLMGLKALYMESK